MTRKGTNFSHTACVITHRRTRGHDQSTPKLISSRAMNANRRTILQIRQRRLGGRGCWARAADAGCHSCPIMPS